MFGAPVRQDDEIEAGEVDVFRLDLAAKMSGSLPCQTGFACRHLDERGEAPILLHRSISAESVVEDRDLETSAATAIFSHCCQGGGAGERACKNSASRSRFIDNPPVTTPDAHDRDHQYHGVHS